MSLIYLTTNEITTATLGGDTMDALFPDTALGTGKPWEISRFAAAGTDDFISADLGSSKSMSFASVHFHNIDSGITAIQIQSDDNAGFTSPITRATMTKGDPSFFATWVAVSDRYWRLLFVGTNATPIYIGEWTLGAEVTFTRNQRFGWGIEHMLTQLRVGEFPKLIQIANAAETNSPTRKLTLDFIHRNVAERDEALTMLNACGWGRSGLVIVPDDSDSIVIHGRPDNRFSYTYEDGGVFPYQLVVDEDPGPVLVN